MSVKTPRQARGEASNVKSPVVSNSGKSIPIKRPRLLLPGTGRPDGQFANEAGEILGPLNVLFRMENQSVVEITHEESNGAFDRFKLGLGRRKFSPLTPSRFRTWIEQHIETSVNHNGPFAPKTMSEACAKSVLQAPQLIKHLPKIYRILDIPVPIKLYSGDVIYPEPGFNRELGIYCANNCPSLDLMSPQEAIEVLNSKAHLGFCWENSQSEVHAFARLLTPYGRGLIGFGYRIPLWFFEGNRPRCGKDYLAGITQIIYLGGAFEDLAITDNHDETPKRIITALRSGRRMMHFANCQHHLGDAILIQAITAPTLSGRALGSNDSRSDLNLPNEIDYSLSANIGLTYREDLEPRMRKIQLAFNEEDANQRTFSDPLLHDHVARDRWKILSAIHSLYVPWIKAGMPSGKTPFVSFPQWANSIGGLMHFHSLGDPCLPHQDKGILGGDLKERAMRALFELGYSAFPNDWIRKKDLYDLIRSHRESDDRLDFFGNFDAQNEKEKRAASTAAGIAINSFKNRILSNIQLQIDSSHSKSQDRLYRFVKID